MFTSKSIFKIYTICTLSGLFASIIACFLFWSIFSTAWVFFLIPVIEGWCLTKFAKIPREELEEDTETIANKTGIVCAAITFLCIFITVSPILLFGDFEIILLNFIFWLACILAVYTAYRKGVATITDAYYDSLN